MSFKLRQLKLREHLFYLLVFLLPTQLGRHFFFNFTYIYGIRNDYLTPTFFLTDMIILAIILNELLLLLKRKSAGTVIKFSSKLILWLSLLFILLFISVLISPNTFAALYKSIKIIEFIILGWVIVRIKAKESLSILLFASGIIYSSLIAWGQFILQRSIGGFLWFLGERSFYVSTPSIALQSLGGRLLLRPYATFPHPNVLAGFLAVMIPVLIYYYSRKGQASLSFWSKKVYEAAIILGLTTLIVTFSRAAWTVGLIGSLIAFKSGKVNKAFLFKYFQKKFLYVFFCLFLLSVMIPPTFTKLFNLTSGSLYERSQLIASSWSLIKLHPIFGVGLNNSLVFQREYLDNNFGLYIFQPVHNLYLLILTETGVIGLIILTVFLSWVLKKAMKNNGWKMIGMISILLLGFFDHYFFTLQQGQLLFTILVSFALIPQKRLT